MAVNTKTHQQRCLVRYYFEMIVQTTRAKVKIAKSSSCFDMNRYFKQKRREPQNKNDLKRGNKTTKTN